MVNRQRPEGELVAVYEGGIRTKSIFRSDENWADENTCARYNQKNDRKYYRKSTQKDSVSEGLKKSIKKGTPGIMAHIRLRSANGGVLLKHHFPPMKQTTDAEYYCKSARIGLLPANRWDVT